MRIDSFSKKQKIILIVLLAVTVAVAAATVVLALSCRPQAGDDGPEDFLSQNEWSIEANEEQTEAREPDAIFQADADHPMPADGAVLKLGEPFAIGGVVFCSDPMSAVTVSVTCAHNGREPYPYKKAVRFSGKGPGRYALTDAPQDGEVSLSEQVDFTEFLVGVHTLTVSVSCKGMRSKEVFRCRFYVVGDDWEQITEASFPDSYPEALAFFGDTERFLYRYQRVNGRYILADPEWEKTYITPVEAYPDGAPWLMHVDAVPYFTKAFAYLEAVHVRVHGTNGDTGVLPLKRLITEYNGCYVSRFTSSLKAISHHTFGTAVDVNASMQPNKNDNANTALIDDDVKGHLAYNGIVTEDGVAYYDFTYDGSYENDPNGVPQTCVNYLLYELAFYRAGFEWAHYYKSTSDAMHFCLSEFVTYTHEGEMGLKKVFAYAESDPAETASEAPETPAPDGTQPPEATPADTPQDSEAPVGSPADTPQDSAAPSDN